MPESMAELLNDADSGISKRFREFLPVVVDVETGGFNCDTDALLEISAVPIIFDDEEKLSPADCISVNVEAFPGAVVTESSLQFTGIDLDDPSRMALPEQEALMTVFQPIRQMIRDQNCKRAILVAHNAHFDLGFVHAASERCKIKRNPFHPFSCFDTATLAGLAYGQTVLARACQAAGISFDNESAHSATYDAIKTAELFCMIVNRWDKHIGWQQQTAAT